MLRADGKNRSSLLTVTPGMKSWSFGAFPGTVYQSVRGHMQRLLRRRKSTAALAVVVDTARAGNLGLVVIDGSMAMAGNWGLR